MGGNCSREATFQAEDSVKLEIDVDPHEPEGDVHMLIVGLDYSCDRWSWAGPPPNGHGPLDTRYAFDMMVELAQKCEVATLKTLWNQQATKEGIAAAIQEVGQNCNPGDYLVFYYTGHGDQLPQDDQGEGLEEFDQCFCTVDAYGNCDDPTMQYRQQVWMRDDEFVNALLDSLEDNPDVKVLVLLDCCHSATMCDFTPDSEWARRRQTAVSISGCEDSQTSAGTGKGGYFTRALTVAVQYMEDNEDNYMVSQVYDKILDVYAANKSPAHTQNITVHGCNLRPWEVAWPLRPKSMYVSPCLTGGRGLDPVKDAKIKMVMPED
eukprot:TRINITY_DN31130_c0_g1_i1.p2 TRINITY_DN31130_c0_g1~~TRINITY_DN31130_c0_g1_i1.p2  ORF type:complete len:348 (-),score=84.09 TRINITY_DN31130_c0_g1_i1:79-1041(-)